MSSLDPYEEGFIPVEGRDNLFRDPYSKAIVNTDKTEYAKYMDAIKRRESQTTKVDSLQNDVSALKSDIEYMKKLLMKLAKEDNDAR
jgi:hypothetical protein